MQAAPAAAVYVTGTDTGIGKTVASVALLHALRGHGCRAVGMKPVASGCARDAAGQWRNEDALALQAASQPRPAYAQVNPYALPLPLAPELAAADGGVSIDMPELTQAFEQLQTQADAVVVEGVGGWLAPLSATLEQADLVRDWQLPVLLVVGLRLGCINHARLTAQAIQADGCRLLGWIGTTLEPQMPASDAVLEILQRHLPVPCWGVLPFGSHEDAASAAAVLQSAVAGWLAAMAQVEATSR